MLQTLSIVTITYNNAEDLINTYDSLESFRKAGGTHIVVNGGTPITQLIGDDCVIHEEPDEGIYDALNKGIELVQTRYFMLIHSGDLFSSNCNLLQRQLEHMENERLDILLNDCRIGFGGGSRLMSSKYWKQWMFTFGAQPPHPPTIYRLSFVKNIEYDLRHPVIADFDYFERVFSKNPRFSKGNELLIHMSLGGKTSSGFSSYFLVNREFLKLKGPFKGLQIIFLRPLFKVLQWL